MLTKDLQDVEGTGVAPDANVPAEEALDAATQLAMEQIRKNETRKRLVNRSS
jgi:hypothetical protein